MKPGRLGFLGEGYPASLLSMPVASSVATGTALRAAFGRSQRKKDSAPHPSPKNAPMVFLEGPRR